MRVLLVVAALTTASSAGPAAAVPQRPSGCPPAQTRTLVKTFIAAFNRGDQTALNQTWASKVWFQWYSVSAGPAARTSQDAARRERLLPYFAARHSVNERLTLTALKMNGLSAGAYRNFEFTLLRSADDLPSSPRPNLGKGASTCSSGRLLVWAMIEAR